jgi:hypothetical protein
MYTLYIFVWIIFVAFFFTFFFIHQPPECGFHVLSVWDTPPELSSKWMCACFYEIWKFISYRMLCLWLHCFRMLVRKFFWAHDCGNLITNQLLFVYNRPRCWVGEHGMKVNRILLLLIFWVCAEIFLVSD